MRGCIQDEIYLPTYVLCPGSRVFLMPQAPLCRGESHVENEFFLLGSADTDSFLKAMFTR